MREHIDITVTFKADAALLQRIDALLEFLSHKDEVEMKRLAAKLGESSDDLAAAVAANTVKE